MNHYLDDNNNKDRLKHKALMYVFGKAVPKIVSVISMNERKQYCVKCEEPDWAGRYYYEYFNMGDGYDKQISDALRELKWIEDGNEFPSTT